MTDYWISFRIHYDNAKNYQKRYDALTQAIEDCAEPGPSWDTNTSFVAIRSKYGLLPIAEHLKKAISASTDHVVVRIIGKTDTAYAGSPGTNFATFFPDAKKV
jgi:hypothetical protein